MNSTYYTDTTLHTLINKYFDAETTLDEERTLRRMLADARYTSAEADEARAVLSVSVTGAISSPIGGSAGYHVHGWPWQHP
ncbi:MAG: hypothetical protein NC043_00290 [Muribaculaceae bacterium]|nr:hypothetical protein [Muribaculaceae bacterium]